MLQIRLLPCLLAAAALAVAALATIALAGSAGAATAAPRPSCSPPSLTLPIARPTCPTPTPRRCGVFALVACVGIVMLVGYLLIRQHLSAINQE